VGLFQTAVFIPETAAALALNGLLRRFHILWTVHHDIRG